VRFRASALVVGATPILLVVRPPGLPARKARLAVVRERLGVCVVLFVLAVWASEVILAAVVPGVLGPVVRLFEALAAVLLLRYRPHVLPILDVCLAVQAWLLGRRGRRGAHVAPAPDELAAVIVRASGPDGRPLPALTAPPLLCITPGLLPIPQAVLTVVGRVRPATGDDLRVAAPFVLVVAAPRLLRLRPARRPGDEPGFAIESGRRRQAVQTAHEVADGVLRLGHGRERVKPVWAGAADAPVQAAPRHLRRRPGRPPVLRAGLAVKGEVALLAALLVRPAAEVPLEGAPLLHDRITVGQVA